MTRLTVRAALMAATLLLLAAPSALAQAPPTLNGELFLSFFEPQDATSTRVIDVTCDPAGVSTVTFTVTGSASGAYNGTFVETVTARIGDQSLLPPVPNTGPFVPYSYGFNTGPVLLFDAEFEITPFPGDPTYERVTGFKRVIADAPLNSGFCFELENGSVPGFPVLVTGYSVGLQAELTYRALIETTSGTYRDEGTAGAVAREGFLTDNSSPDPVRARVGGFGERFTSSLLQPVLADLKPGLGCGDKNHIHEREDDCKFDPK